VPQLPGINLKNVFTLREYTDLEKLREKAKDSSKLVVIGASFIGLEAAASLKSVLKDKLDVVVCDNTLVPYERVMGKEVG
jgi:NADPH-dependent 2,4-dienoyl-CoA reductase/sulfur reductase-like enzyme